MKVFVVVVLLAIVALVAAGEGKGMQQVCNGEPGKFDAEDKKLFEDCKHVFQNMGEGKKGKMEAAGKLTICVWDKQGIIEGDSINKVKFTASCKKLFKDNGEKLGNTISEKCFGNVHGLKKDDLSTFKDLFICVFKTWSMVCPDSMKGMKQNAEE